MSNHTWTYYDAVALDNELLKHIGECRAQGMYYPKEKRRRLCIAIESRLGHLSNATLTEPGILRAILDLKDEFQPPLVEVPNPPRSLNRRGYPYP